MFVYLMRKVKKFVDWRIHMKTSWVDSFVIGAVIIAVRLIMLVPIGIFLLIFGELQSYLT